MKLQNKKRTFQMVALFLAFSSVFILSFVQVAFHIKEQATPVPVQSELIRDAVQDEVYEYFGMEEKDGLRILRVEERQGDMVAIVGITGIQYIAHFSGNKIVSAGLY